MNQLTSILKFFFLFCFLILTSKPSVEVLCCLTCGNFLFPLLLLCLFLFRSSFLRCCGCGKTTISRYFSTILLLRVGVISRDIINNILGFLDNIVCKLQNLVIKIDVVVIKTIFDDILNIHLVKLCDNIICADRLKRTTGFSYYRLPNRAIGSKVLDYFFIILGDDVCLVLCCLCLTRKFCCSSNNLQRTTWSEIKYIAVCLHALLTVLFIYVRRLNTENRLHISCRT